MPKLLRNTEKFFVALFHRFTFRRELQTQTSIPIPLTDAAVHLNARSLPKIIHTQNQRHPTKKSNE
jgi:hypothetical protein